MALTCLSGGSDGWVDMGSGYPPGGLPSERGVTRRPSSEPIRAQRQTLLESGTRTVRIVDLSVHVDAAAPRRTVSDSAPSRSVPARPMVIAH